MDEYPPLVSIVIPTFNRADLLSVTLESIIGQTFRNWECVLVDDGSSDRNVEVINEFAALDNRFRLIERNQYTANKGANICRNLGLEVAKGEYIIFFDSDDLMCSDHVGQKVSVVEKHNLDMAVFRTKTLEGGEIPKHFYGDLDKLPITLENYVRQKINWLTPDVIIKSEVAKMIRFNEGLKSGQEYNYYCKLLSQGVNVIQNDRVLTLRRMHGDSIQGRLTGIERIKQQQEAHFVTLEELQGVDNGDAHRHLIKIVLRNGFQISDFSAIPINRFIKMMLSHVGLFKTGVFVMTWAVLRVNKRLSNFLMKGL